MCPRAAHAEMRGEHVIFSIRTKRWNLNRSSYRKSLVRETQYHQGNGDEERIGIRMMQKQRKHEAKLLRFRWKAFHLRWLKLIYQRHRDSPLRWAEQAVSGWSCCKSTWFSDSRRLALTYVIPSHFSRPSYNSHFFSVPSIPQLK